MTLEWRSKQAEALHRALIRHVAKPWFPRCVDRADGGFLCDFDRRWRPIGPQHRLLEFQARQTRTAARMGTALPADASWAAIVRHGVRYLDEVMRDREHGGFFGLVDRSGRPQLAGTKHAHGVAYLIGAGAEAYRLTGEQLPLTIAREAFDWLDGALHDDEHGGYHGWATRDGRPILEQADLPAELAGGDTDPLGHPIGVKDANVHSDLLQGLTLLASVTNDTHVRRRLAEVYDVLAASFITAAGEVHYLLERDLRPVPGPELYGYPLQSGNRLIRAASALGRPESDARALAQRLLDHALAVAWTARGGGFIEQEARRVRPWWIQTEGAKLLLQIAIDEADPANPYLARYSELLAAIEREFVDHRHGGWEVLARSDWPLRSRLPWRGLPKSDMWKDASHEADMYLAGIRVLTGLGPDAPIA
jgi:mannobiose 2-epimerase